MAVGKSGERANRDRMAISFGNIPIANNGKMVSRIPIHPKDANFRSNIWGGVALDRDKGIVYANTGNPHPAIIGINRKGDNKRSSSVVAIDLNKEKLSKSLYLNQLINLKNVDL